MEVTRPACDVFNHEEYPRVAFDDVQEVEIDVFINKEKVLKCADVMCRKARERLLAGIARLRKPPAKREKELNPGAPAQIGGAQV